MKEFYLRNEKRISRVATIIILIALVRTISEPFRLQYYSSSTLGFGDVKPYLLGGLVISIGLLAMTVFSFYNKYKFITLLAILVIIGMLIIKFEYIL
ncbi:MAG: hypothetical protein IPP15_11435 [Saprospiraceae bacterium]|uniref:Uncharacterized protein n=1 Tax=Candidatus Opimibacter skivensis TaxID=2982028 RepID=A0A9D7SVS9_9BACT|nr:hypothetical protein [Candidatus Opimibacter skivensis]